MFLGRTTQRRARSEFSSGMKHSPSTTNSQNGDDARTQYGAICWRKADGNIDVLLITSRETGRWVIPKGWPVKGLRGHGSAEREAWEEAGVEGKVGKTCLGLFSYQKVLPQDQCVPCVVAIYGLHVEKLSRRYPEQRQRQRKWFPADIAATLVAEPELSALFLALHDGKLALEDVSDGKKAKSAGR
jgi:8-oxo-dGTP pyrophosphatase MutT (NUDIX family)